jgi:hypothetical protein
MSRWALALPWRAIWIAPYVLVLSGCFPMRYTERPSVIGKVVDANNGASVKSANVEFRPFDSGIEAVSSPGTDAGDFTIPAKKFWGIAFAQMDFVTLRAGLEITAPGFQTLRRLVAWSPGGPSLINLGNIRMLKDGPNSEMSHPDLRPAEAYELTVDTTGQCFINAAPAYCPEVAIELRRLHPIANPRIIVCNVRKAYWPAAEQVFQGLQAESLNFELSKDCGQ